MSRLWDRVLFACLVIWIVLLPLPYGAVLPAQWLPWGAGLLGLLALVAVGEAAGAPPRLLPALRTRRQAMVALVAAWTAVLFQFWWSGGGWPAGRYLSQAADATVLEAARLGIYLAVFVVVAALAPTAGRQRLLALALIAAGLLETLVGILDLHYQLGIVPAKLRDGHFDRITGTFVNRNHYANLVAMILPLALAFLAAGTADRERGLWVTVLGALLRGRTVAWLAVAAFLLGGLVYSGSRGGVLALVAGVATVLLLRGRRPRTGRGRSRPQVVTLVALGLVALLLGGEMVGWGTLPERFANLRLAGDERLLQWRQTLAMAADHPWLGSGYGSYAYVFPRYKTPAMAGHGYDHAHNDYLEALATLGVGGSVLLFGALAIIVTGNLRAALRLARRGSRRAPLALGANAGALAFLFHSAVDFSFYITANAVYFFVLLAVGYPGAAGRQGIEGSQRSMAR